jgi:PAS domain S-box-containing protein
LAHGSVTPQTALPRLLFRVAPEPSHLLRARERMRDYLRQYCTERQVIDDVVLCVEEACTNAIRHGGTRDDIEVTLRFSGGELHATVIDHGQGFDVGGFDPAAQPDPDADHGRGLFIIAALMDSLELRRNGGLELHMVRRAQPRCEPAALDSGLGERVAGSHDQREARTRALLEEIDEGFVALDWEYRYTYINGHACRLLGRRREELLGSTPFAVFRRLRGSELERGFRAAMELGTPTAIEWYSPIVDDWVETRIYPTPAGVTAYFRVIGERKRKELEREELLAALRDSRQRYKELFQSESDALLLIDHETGRVLEANQAAEAMYGYSTEELLGLTDLDLTAEPEQTRSATQSAGVGENVAIPCRIHRRKDGTTFAVEMTGRVFSLQGRAVRVAAVRDVTARKRAEEVLGRFELLAAHSRDIILFMDRGGQIIEANAAAERAYGYTRDELLKLTVADLRAVQAEAQMAAQMTEADERGILFESLHRRKDGTVFPVEVSSRGASVGGRRTLVSVVRDITERKRAEEALRDAEAKAAALIRYAPTAIYEIEFQGPAYKIVNDAMCAMSGYSREELLAMNPFDLLDDESRAVFAERIRKARDGQPIPDSVEYRFITKDGRLRSGVLYTSFTSTDGVIDGALVVGYDITERKQAQQARDEAFRFGEALNAIDALVHSSFHAEEIIQTALREGAQAIGAESAGLSLHDDEAREFRVAYVHDHPPDRVGVRIPDGEDTHGVEAMRTGKTLAIDDVRADPRVVRSLMDAWQIKSVICAPLLVQGKAIGVVYYSYRSAPHHFSVAEIDFTTRLAASLSTAVENAHLYEAQRTIAQTLQENFIHPLPVVAGLDLGVVSQTAHEPELVGGDFSDVFVVDDRHVVVLIGDVAGKGVRAAGLTETVRAKIRAFATIEASPSFILAKTNELLLRFNPDDPHVTAFCAVLDPHTGHLSYASAGHPAPLHVGASTCRALDVNFGTPLGSFARPYAASHVTLTLDDYVVLYTDGVTEARREGELLGEQRLLELVSGLRGGSAQEVAQGVLEAASDFAGGRLSDDLQVVVVRLA